MNITVSDLSEKVKLIDIKTDKFLTSKIQAVFTVPADSKTVSAYSLLPFYLVRTTKKYNTQKKFMEKLAELYGASVSSSVLKKGDNLQIEVSISSLKNSLSFSNEDIFADLQEMLYEIIFNPNTDDGKFIAEHVENEKRLAFEKLESEINDKRKYAVRKTIELICDGEPFGIPKYGTKEELEKINEKNLFDAYQKFLDEAKITLISSSEKGIDKESKIIKSFVSCGQTSAVQNENILKSARENTLYKSENLDVNQAKLVLGFRGKSKVSLRDSAKYRIMADIFGGGPYSLLFLNVREKESLCYYCSTSYEKSKQLMIVHSGVEFENLEKTEKEIIKYFDIVKNGSFDDETFEASKKSLKEIYGAMNDSIDTVAAWYASQPDDEEHLSPEEYIKLIASVTREDVVSAASDFKLDTVFSIKGL